MKVWNLTDAPTPALVEQRLVNVALLVEGVMLQPGAHLEVSPAVAHRIRVGQSTLVVVGALHLGDPPKSYVPSKKPELSSEKRVEKVKSKKFRRSY